MAALLPQPATHLQNVSYVVLDKNRLEKFSQTPQNMLLNATLL